MEEEVDPAGVSGEADLFDGNWGIARSISANIISFSCVLKHYLRRKVRFRD